MRKDRYVKRHFHKKSLTLVLALALSCVLLVCGVVGGTLAWLTAKATPVTNTFTTSTIGVDLKETTSDYKMIPGWDIAKNPKAWITEGSEDAYLFVKIEESTNFDDFMTYAIADGWTSLEGTAAANIDTTTNDTIILYRVVAAGNSATNIDDPNAYEILKDNKVSVSGDVTKEMMNALDEEGAIQPTLTFTAYASQYWKQSGVEFKPEDAWKNIPGNS